MKCLGLLSIWYHFSKATKTSIKSYFMMHFPSWYYSFQKVMHFINTDNTLNMMSAIMRTLHWVSVPPGVSKNPTHSRYRSYLPKAFLPLPAVGLPNCYPKKGESLFPATSSRRRGAAKPSPLRPHTSPRGAGAKCCRPRTPRGALAPPLPHSSAQQPRSLPAAQQRLPPPRYRETPAARGAPSEPVLTSSASSRTGAAGPCDMAAITFALCSGRGHLLGPPARGNGGGPSRGAQVAAGGWSVPGGSRAGRAATGGGRWRPAPPVPPRGGEPRPQPRRAPPAEAAPGRGGAAGAAPRAGGRHFPRASKGGFLFPPLRQEKRAGGCRRHAKLRNGKTIN